MWPTLTGKNLTLWKHFFFEEITLIQQADISEYGEAASPESDQLTFSLIKELIFIMHLLQNSPDNMGMITLRDIRSL